MIEVTKASSKGAKGELPWWAPPIARQAIRPYLTPFYIEILSTIFLVTFRFVRSYILVVRGSA